MKKLAVLLAGFAFSALPCTSALASTLSFSFGSSPVSSTNPSSFSASGTLTYSPTAVANTFLVTAATGSILYNGANYALTLLPTGVLGFAGNDNLFFAPPNAPFDFFGLGLGLVSSNPPLDLNLFTDTVNNVITPFELLGIPNGSQIGTESSPFTITLLPDGVPPPPPTTATPEPGSLALLGTGALAAFGMLRRKLAV